LRPLDRRRQGLEHAAAGIVAWHCAAPVFVSAVHEAIV
jgi:hypothetical protein